jgi:hypothetical protein
LDVSIPVITPLAGPKECAQTYMTDLAVKGIADVLLAFSNGRTLFLRTGLCGVYGGVCSDRGGCVAKGMHGVCACAEGYEGPQCESCAPGFGSYAASESGAEEAAAVSAGGVGALQCGRCEGLGWGKYSTSRDSTCECLPSFERDFSRYEGLLSFRVLDFYDACRANP